MSVCVLKVLLALLVTIGVKLLASRDRVQEMIGRSVAGNLEMELSARGYCGIVWHGREMMSGSRQ